jgi:hypothetical protein
MTSPAPGENVLNRTKVVVWITEASLVAGLGFLIGSYFSLRTLQWGTLIFGFCAVLVLSAEYGYASAAYTYDYRRKSIFELILAARWNQPAVASRGREALLTMMMSYVLFVFFFGCLYHLLAAIPGAFHGDVEGVIDAMYFSTATALTIGYGDIYPVSDAARFVVIIQGAVSLLYVVFLFSSVSIALQEGAGGPPKGAP